MDLNCHIDIEEAIAKSDEKLLLTRVERLKDTVYGSADDFLKEIMFVNRLIEVYGKSDTILTVWNEISNANKTFENIDSRFEYWIDYFCSLLPKMVTQNACQYVILLFLNFIEKTFESGLNNLKLQGSALSDVIRIGRVYKMLIENSQIKNYLNSQGSMSVLTVLTKMESNEENENENKNENKNERRKNCIKFINGLNDDKADEWLFLVFICRFHRKLNENDEICKLLFKNEERLEGYFCGNNFKLARMVSGTYASRLLLFEIFSNSAVHWIIATLSGSCILWETKDEALKYGIKLKDENNKYSEIIRQFENEAKPRIIRLLTRKENLGKLADAAISAEDRPLAIAAVSRMCGDISDSQAQKYEKLLNHLNQFDKYLETIGIGWCDDDFVQRVSRAWKNQLPNLRHEMDQQIFKQATFTSAIQQILEEIRIA